MYETLLKIIKSREDLSDYLFHFTKNSDAKITLGKILESNELKDLGNKGFLCFTEAPITLLVDMFKIFDAYQNPMYSPYGIAVKKDYFFSLGGRPVIYGTKEDKEEILETSHWRFEEYVPNVKDFSWLREWRIKSKSLELDKDNFFVIAKTKQEIEDITFELVDVEFDGDVADGQYWGFATGITERNFKGVSLEEIGEINRLSKQELQDIIDKQNFDESGGINLGSFKI